MTTPPIPEVCPGCGHATVHAVGGICSVFVPGPPDGPLAVYCGHDCYRAITGETITDRFARTMWGTEKETE